MFFNKLTLFHWKNWQHYSNTWSWAYKPMSRFIGFSEKLFQPEHISGNSSFCISNFRSLKKSCLSDFNSSRLWFRIACFLNVAINLSWSILFILRSGLTDYSSLCLVKMCLFNQLWKDLQKKHGRIGFLYFLGLKLLILATVAVLLSWSSSSVSITSQELSEATPESQL